MSADLKKAVLFDCDGVLVNTEELGYHTLRIMLGEHDFGYTRAEFLELVSGYEQCETMRVIQEDFKRLKGYDLPEDFGEQLWARVREYDDEFLDAIEGMRETLAMLKKAGIPVAVCSNGDRETVQRNLQKTGLADYFGDHIYTKNDVQNSKPAPDLYELGAARLGVRPEECFVVEDSQTGTKAGVAAGATVIGFLAESHRHMEKEAFLKEEFLLAAAGASTIAASGADLKKHLAAGLGIGKPRCPLLAVFVGQNKNARKL